MKDAELRETIRVAFSRYDEDGSGAIDATELRNLVHDLGGVLTDSDLKSALHMLDRDRNGVIDLQEFISWWTTQAADLDGDGAVTDLEKTLERLKEFGRERFHVDIHTAAWSGSHDVVARLVEDDKELANEKDVTEYGNMNSPLHYAAYQGHVIVCSTLGTLIQLGHGASVNVTNGSGCTPVFYAAQQSHEQVVNLLLQKGADIKIKDTEVRRQLGGAAVFFASHGLYRSLSPSVASALSCRRLQHRVDHQAVSESLWIWQSPKPKLNEVAPISLYKLKLASKTAPLKTVLIPGAATEAVVGELVPSTEYTCQIAALNLHGMSDFSSNSEPTMTLQAKPSPPQNLGVSEVDCHSVVLRWSFVDGEEATHCVVQQSMGSDDIWKTVFKGEAPIAYVIRPQTAVLLGLHPTVPLLIYLFHRRSLRNSSTTIEKLFGDRKYLFRVAAINSTGCGDFSAPVLVHTTPTTGNAKRAAKQVTKTKVAVNAVKQLAALARKTASHPPRSHDVSGSRESKQREEVTPNESKSPSARGKLEQQRPEQSEAKESGFSRLRQRGRNAEEKDGEQHSDDDFVYYSSDGSSSS